MPRPTTSPQSQMSSRTKERRSALACWILLGGASYPRPICAAGVWPSAEGGGPSVTVPGGRRWPTRPSHAGRPPPAGIAPGPPRGRRAPARDRRGGRACFSAPVGAVSSTARVVTVCPGFHSHRQLLCCTSPARLAAVDARCHRESPSVGGVRILVTRYFAQVAECARARPWRCAPAVRTPAEFGRGRPIEVEGATCTRTWPRAAWRTCAARIHRPARRRGPARARVAMRKTKDREFEPASPMDEERRGVVIITRAGSGCRRSCSRAIDITRFASHHDCSVYDSVWPSHPFTLPCSIPATRPSRAPGRVSRADARGHSGRRYLTLPRPGGSATRPGPTGASTTVSERSRQPQVARLGGRRVLARPLAVTSDGVCLSAGSERLLQSKHLLDSRNGRPGWIGAAAAEGLHAASGIESAGCVSRCSGDSSNCFPRRRIPMAKAMDGLKEPARLARQSSAVRGGRRNLAVFG
jgi:hypothetical protein